MPNSKAQLSDKSQGTKSKVYDFNERATKFASDVIGFCQLISKNAITSPIVSQLVRAGTSIGANYAEADEASSRKDFINKVCIAKKEARETCYWLEIITKSYPQYAVRLRTVSQEARELNLILAAIVRNAKQNEKISE